MSSVTTEELWDRIRGELHTLRGGIEDRITAEISAVRGEVDTLRVGIEYRLTTEISAVRFDFAHALRTEVGGIRNELREFRAEFDSFRDDALGHFDNLYGRLDAQAMEHQALSAAVARLEKRGPAPSN